MSEKTRCLAVIEQLLNFPDQWSIDYSSWLEHKPSGLRLGYGFIFGINVIYPEKYNLGIQPRIRWKMHKVRVALKRKQQETVPESIKNLCHFNHQAKTMIGLGSLLNQATFRPPKK